MFSELTAREGPGERVIHADYTHSLGGALVIAITFGLVCSLVWRRSVAVVLAAVVFSHWALDLPMASTARVRMRRTFRCGRGGGC